MGAFHWVWRERGEPAAVADGTVADGHYAVGIACLGSPPVMRVLRHAGAITRPALGIGRATGVEEAQGHRPSSPAKQAEEEPLVEIRLAVAQDFQIETVAFGTDEAAIGAVQVGRDRQARLIIMVCPD